MVAVCTILGLCQGAAYARETMPNILVIFGDDIGSTNVSAHSLGLMG